MSKYTIGQIKDELKVIDPYEKKHIEENIDESTSEYDLTDVVGRQFHDDIILYSDLQNYNTIQELLPTDKSFKIILIRETENTGHWVVILRYKNTIEWFNSYGLEPSGDLKLIDQQVNISLGQNKKLLDILLDKAVKDGFNVVYNKKPLQKFSNDKLTIASCGKHVCLRILMLQKYNMDLKKYLSFMDELKKISRLNYDEIVTLIIK